MTACRGLLLCFDLGQKLGAATDPIDGRGFRQKSRKQFANAIPCIPCVRPSPHRMEKFAQVSGQLALTHENFRVFGVETVYIEKEIPLLITPPPRAVTALGLAGMAKGADENSARARHHL